MNLLHSVVLPERVLDLGFSSCNAVDIDYGEGISYGNFATAGKSQTSKMLKCFTILYYRLDEISFKVYRAWIFEDSFGAQVIESNGEELGGMLNDSYISSFTGRAVDLT